MAKAIQILNNTFRTKKEAEDFTRVILYKYSFGEPLQGSDLDFISELLERHPDSELKKGVGVKSIIVRPDEKYDRTRHFCIERLDNTTIDFSFKKCFSDNPNNPEKLFKAAARRAVEKEIIYFFNAYFAKVQDSDGKVQCALTGELVDKDNATVDHTPPDTFDKIVNDFIAQNNIDFNTIEFTSGDTYKIGKAFADENLVKEFATYHKQFSKLRITTRTANLKQKKKNW